MALAFREVAPEQRLLQEEVRRLERTAGYRVLAHRAWRQPFRAEAPALPVRIRHEDPVSGEIDLAGSVGIALRRFLHARLELYRRVPDVDGDRQPAPDAVSGLSPFRQPGGEGIAPIILELPPEAPEAADGWIRIVHERRMRSGETHYLDHPRIAALIRIERFLLAEPLDEDGPVVRAIGD
ncbi:MAG: CsiV family protein [Gammaproteobacteria bacterium]|nr:CsiV family protein [Gammaproteobacteria bacterium]